MDNVCVAVVAWVVVIPDFDLFLRLGGAGPALAVQPRAEEAGDAAVEVGGAGFCRLFFVFRRVVCEAHPGAGTHCIKRTPHNNSAVLTPPTSLAALPVKAARRGQLELRDVHFSYPARPEVCVCGWGVGGGGGGRGGG